MRRYMRMVLLIYTLIQATCDGLWELHVESIDEVCKYFFAHDNLKYARLFSLYLAGMTALQTTDPDKYQEFMNGNFTVHKNNKCLSVLSGWTMSLSTSIASWRPQEVLWALHRIRCPWDSLLQHQHWAGSPKKHIRWLTLQQLQGGNMMVCTLLCELSLENVIRSSRNPMTY